MEVIMEIVKFYQDLLASLDVSIDEDGYLKSKIDDENEIYITRLKGMKIKLPTKENLDNMYHADSTGKFVRSYLIFNPLSESAYEDGYSLELLIDLVKRSLSLSLAALGDLLIIAYSQPKLQHDLPIELQEFISNAKDKSVAGMKATGKAIDDTMLNKWKKYIESFTTNIDKDMFTLVVPRTKRINDVMSNTREARLTSSLYKDFSEALGSESNVTISGVSLRPKDIKIFLDIIKLFLVGHDEKGLVVEGTDDTISPGFIALMKLAFKILQPAYRYINALGIANPLYKDLTNKVLMSIEQIEAAPTLYKKELASIPSDTEMNKGTNVLNNKQGINVNTKNLHTAVNTAVTKPLDYQPDTPKSGADLILRKVQNENEMRIMAGSGYGMYRPMQVKTAMPQKIRPGMVSRLNPSLNSQEAQQVYLQEQQMQQAYMQPPMMPMAQGMYMPGMVQQAPMVPMQQTVGYGNVGTVGNTGTYVGAYGTYSYGTGWGR